MHPLSKITVSTYAQTAGCCPGVEHSTTSFFTWILLNVCMSLAEGEMNPFLKTKGREGDVTVPSESFLLPSFFIFHKRNPKSAV